MNGGVFPPNLQLFDWQKNKFWSSCTVRESSYHIRASRMLFQRELSGTSPVVWDSQRCIEKAPLKKRVETRTREGNEVKPIRQIVLTSKTVWPDESQYDQAQIEWLWCCCVCGQSILPDSCQTRVVEDVPQAKNVCIGFTNIQTVDPLYVFQPATSQPQALSERQQIKTACSKWRSRTWLHRILSQLGCIFQ